MLEGAWAGQNPFFYQCVQTKKKNKNLKKKMQKKSPAKQILGGQNPPFLFFLGPLMKNWGFASQLKNVYLGSTIAKFLPGPLAKNFCWLVQPLNENLGFRLPAGKSLLRFHYRQIFTRSPGKKLFVGW